MRLRSLLVDNIPMFIATALLPSPTLSANLVGPTLRGLTHFGGSENMLPELADTQAQLVVARTQAQWQKLWQLLQPDFIDNGREQLLFADAPALPRNAMAVAVLATQKQAHPTQIIISAVQPLANSSSHNSSQWQLHWQFRRFIDEPAEPCQPYMVLILKKQAGKITALQEPDVLVPNRPQELPTALWGAESAASHKQNIFLTPWHPPHLRFC